MSVLTDARPHFTAVHSVVSAQVGLAPNGDDRVFDHNDVPKSVPNIYVIVYVERRNNPSLRLTAQASFAGWRLSVRCVGRTPDEVRWAMNKVAAAINEKALTVSGELTTPIQFENEEAPALDDGRYSALVRYTYAR